MTALLALLLLASAAGAGLSPLPLLAIAFVGLLASGMSRWSRSAPAMTQPAGEVVVATIYERQGRLVLRRRKEQP